MGKKTKKYLICGLFFMLFLETFCFAANSNFVVNWTSQVFLHEDVGEKKKESSVEDFRRELGARWSTPITVYGANMGVTDSVCDCNGFFQAQKKKLQPYNQDKRNDYSLVAADCIAAKLIINAKPANKSFIQNLKVDKKIVYQLPPQVGFLEGNFSAEQLSKFKNLAEFDAPITVTEKDGNVIVDSKGLREYIAELARGDFNNDGLDDVMMEITQIATEGTLRVDNVYIFSKLKADGPLTMVGRYPVY